MFQFNHHHQGAYYLICIYAVTPPNQPQRYILITITLASSNNTLPDDGE